MTTTYVYQVTVSSHGYHDGVPMRHVPRTCFGTLAEAQVYGAGRWALMDPKTTYTTDRLGELVWEQETADRWALSDCKVGPGEHDFERGTVVVVHRCEVLTR